MKKFLAVVAAGAFLLACSAAPTQSANSDLLPLTLIVNESNYAVYRACDRGTTIYLAKNGSGTAMSVVPNSGC